MALAEFGVGKVAGEWLLTTGTPRTVVESPGVAIDVESRFRSCHVRIEACRSRSSPGRSGGTRQWRSDGFDWEDVPGVFGDDVDDDEVGVVGAIAAVGERDLDRIAAVPLHPSGFHLRLI